MAFYAAKGSGRLKGKTLSLKYSGAPMTIDGQLEIDTQRGVIYFHSNDGITVLRICSLPKPIPAGEQLDITHMVGCNWSQKTVINN